MVQKDVASESVNVSDEQAELSQRAARVAQEPTIGKVYLVGAGPGDAGLITVKGLRYLQAADVIVYDRLASPRLVQMIKPGARKIYVGKLPDQHAMKQEQINELLVSLALEGNNVVRLKGGDPCVFGRVGEEAALLKQNGVSYEIVPGVTSAIAVPAYAGIPVTHRDRASSFTVITGHGKHEGLVNSISWEALGKSTGTLIFLMGVGHLHLITEQLIQHGRDPLTPAALVRWGTRSEQQSLMGTLDTIAEEAERISFSSPAVIVVGEVVLERELLQWAESRPLFGQRILVTRARAQSADFIRAIEDLGGEPYEYPVIESVLPVSVAKLELIKHRMRQIQQYDWLILTSANGVRYWIEHMRVNQMDIRHLAGLSIVAVGPKTAEVMGEYALIPDLVADQFSQEGLWMKLEPLLKPGQRVLMARGDLARSWLADKMRDANVQVDETDIYETVLPEQDDPHMIELLQEGDIQFIPFTSSSTVTNLLKLLHQQGVAEPIQLLNRCQIVCIGEVTAKTARDAGLRVDGVAEVSTMECLLQTMKDIAQGKALLEAR